MIKKYYSKKHDEYIKSLQTAEKMDGNLWYEKQEEIKRELNDDQNIKIVG